jgi:ureidoacrylate peracid hydrolase
MDAAVLVVDIRNGFIHPDGSFPLLGMAQPQMAEAIAANIELVAAARHNGLPVIFTRHVFRPDIRDLPAKMASPLPADPQLLRRGTWDAEIHDNLAPADGELLMDKNRLMRCSTPTSSSSYGGCRSAGFWSPGS